jgi:hypothetical protein
MFGHPVVIQLVLVCMMIRIITIIFIILIAYIIWKIISVDKISYTWATEGLESPPGHKSKNTYFELRIYNNNYYSAYPFLLEAESTPEP